MKHRVFFGLGLGLAVATAWPTVARGGSGEELFVNEDCWHFWVADSGDEECMKRDGFSPLKPGMGATVEGLKAYIDEISRGKVTHFLMNVNGQRANFPSKVLEPVWTSLSEPDRAHEKWVETLKRLADEGCDPYAVWIAHCREKGVSPWISVRMNDLHRVGRADCPNVCTMWREHPEFLLKAGATWGGGFDYSQPQVRERMLSFIREVLDRYDADGLELDLLRFPRYLPEGREQELAPLLTDYIREIRRAVEEASARRGRRIVLSVRVKAVPKENLDRGMNVGEWARQGLVDMVVPCNMWANIRFDIPLGEWREWTGGRVKIVPGADSGITEEGKKRRLATLAEYRRWALEMRKRGADNSFYLYNLFLHPQDGEVWNGILSEGLLPASGAVDHYVVSPMSETPYLPGDVPADGTKGGIVRIVAAKGEYEPGSFVLRAPKDLGSVEVSVGKFENGNGDVFPSEDLDLTVVKVWYQNRNGWYSYFGDCGWKLVPELLLHDEDLIEVDEANERNYARIVREDGSVFRKWLNPPRQVDVGFQSMRKGFSDAPALCRVRLEKNRSKQFFLTANVRPGTPAGVYRGEVKFKGEGEQWTVPVVLRVLDFELPRYPCTYADPYREIFVSSYDTTGFRTIAELNGGDLELAKRQFVAICRNYVAHGQSLIKNPARTADETLATFDVMREAGMRQDVFNGAVRVLRFKDPENHVEEMRAHAKKLAKMLDDEIGHHNVFIAYGDEPGVAWLVRNRPVFDTYRTEGFKFFIAGGDAVFNKCGWCYDWHNVAKSPEDDSSARLWAQLPTHPSVAWYAFQHTGPENPAFNRRQYGLAAYLSGYTAICNLGHGAGLTSYNDDTVTYRPFLMNHRSYDGVLDTLQWEGFREGIDDMRYATLLVRLARKVAALGTSDAKVAANKAAMTLARADRTRDDLGCLRGEIIRQIGLLARYAAPGSVLAPVAAPAARPSKAPHPLPAYKFKPKVFTNVNFTNPEPTNVAHMVRKEYVVRFSDRMISGLGDWELLSVRPEVQNLDRKYKGGSLDFMETDVATGDRGKVTAGAKSLRYSTLQVAADAWGIHFRFEAFSDKAREVALGIGGLGSFESYLAPGPDAPHECFMTAVNSHPKPHVWHSQYDHAGYRRSDANDRNSYRQEVRFTDTSAIVYSAFSWEQFFSYLPKDGDVWDFEVVNWGAVKSAWNGLESIHGRSTWGKLRFAMSASDSRLIRRRLVHFAVRDFRNAFSTNGGEGIAARLMDAATGDSEFYAAAVKPLADELEAAAQRASVDMSDETVDELAREYLARWRDFPYAVQRLRDEYLKDLAASTRWLSQDRFVVSDTNRFTCGSGSVACVSPDGKRLLVPYLASATGFGECHDLTAVADIPLAAPGEAKSFVVLKAGDAFCGTTVTTTLSYASCLWNGRLRIYLDVNSDKYGYREWDPVSRKVVGEGLFKCRFGERTSDLSPRAIADYLSQQGLRGFDPFKERGDRCIWQSRPVWQDGVFYGFVTSSCSQPILFKCADGGTFEFVGAIPTVAEYECQLAIHKGRFYAVMRGAKGDNFWTSADGGVTWSAGGRVPDGLQRPQLLVWRDQVLIGFSAPDEQPSVVRNGRNNLHLLLGEGPDLSAYREVLHAVDPIGIVYPDILAVKDELHVIWSNSERFPTHVKWGAVQGKDQLLYARLPL